MPIIDYPFTSIGGSEIYRPMLPIQVINPHTGKSLNAWGLIDTGADNCALPASLADSLGHNLLKGEAKEINTGNGATKAYAHAIKINIFEIKGNDVNVSNIVHTIEETPIDFMPNLKTVLLGVRHFLSNFTLTISYPLQRFSIRK